MAPCARACTRRHTRARGSSNSASTPSSNSFGTPRRACSTRPHRPPDTGLVDVLAHRPACAETTIASTTGLVDRRTGHGRPTSLTAGASPKRCFRRWSRPARRAGVDDGRGDAHASGRRSPCRSSTLRRTTPQAPSPRWCPRGIAAESSRVGHGLWWAAAPRAGADGRGDGLRASPTRSAPRMSTLVIRNLSGTWLLDECMREWAEVDGADDEASLRDRLLVAEASALPASIVHDRSRCSRTDCQGRDARAPCRPSCPRRWPAGTVSRADRPPDRRQPGGLVRRLRGNGGPTHGSHPPERIHMIGGGSRIGLLVRLTEQAERTARRRRPSRGDQRGEHLRTSRGGRACSLTSPPLVEQSRRTDRATLEAISRDDA